MRTLTAVGKGGCTDFLPAPGPLPRFNWPLRLPLRLRTAIKKGHSKQGKPWIYHQFSKKTAIIDGKPATVYVCKHDPNPKQLSGLNVSGLRTR